MIKDVVHDPIFLSGKSDSATKEDLQVVPVRASVIRPSKFSGKLLNFKLASKPLPVGLRKLFSTKSITVMEF